MTSDKFKPDTLHPDYVQYVNEWERVEDASSGEAAVKAKNNGRAYLTPTMGMSAAEFRLYVHLARFLPAIGKTLQAYNGLIHRKPGVLSGHEKLAADLLQKLLNNFSRKHQTIEDFAEELTLNYSKFKRGGVLTEYPKVEEQPKNLKEFEDTGRLPYSRFFEARQIINWRSTVDHSGRLVLNLVVIKLIATVEDPDNEFAEKEQNQYYILDLITKKGYDRPIYRKRIATKVEDTWQIDESIPIINNSPVFEIPFDFVGPVKPAHSDILPAVEVSFQLYTLSAALNWALHFIGLPTFYTIGVKSPEDLMDVDSEGNERLPLGPSGGLHIPDTDAKIGMVSYEGRGLDLIRDEIKDRRDELAALGSRMLTDERRGVEAEETARIHRSGENAGLTTTAKACSVVLTQQLKRMLTWLGVDPSTLTELKYTLNTDYLPTRIDAQTLDTLFKMFIEGGLPLEDFLLNLKRGEIVDNDRTIEEFEDGLRKPEPEPQPIQVVQPPEEQEEPEEEVDVVED